MSKVLVTVLCYVPLQRQGFAIGSRYDAALGLVGCDAHSWPRVYHRGNVYSLGWMMISGHPIWSL